MEQLELDAAKAKQLLEQWNRVFIEDRLLVSQWCDALVKSYTSATDDIRSKLPPLPGTTAEQMLPSLFVSDPSDLDVEQYKKEKEVLLSIQQQMNTLYLSLRDPRMQQLWVSISRITFSTSLVQVVSSMSNRLHLSILAPIH